jgi:hypothetical protein
MRTNASCNRETATNGARKYSLMEINRSVQRRDK